MSGFGNKNGRVVAPQSPPGGPHPQPHVVVPPPPGGNTDLASLFECPVCFDYVLPPILQCKSGHLVCANCRPKLKRCPTCRGPLGNIRNLAMEKVASTVMFPCKYSGSGCSATLLHTDKTEHEDTCEFRPYMCPCPGASCKWQGALEQVMPHLMSVHKSITTLQASSLVLVQPVAVPVAVPETADAAAGPVRSVSCKHRKIVEASMGHKNADKLPGIGLVLKTNLSQKGYRKARDVFKRFMELNKESFKEWLANFGANSKQTEDCYQCLSSYMDMAHQCLSSYMDIAKTDPILLEF